MGDRNVEMVGMTKKTKKSFKNRKKDRSAIQKPSNAVRCALLNGSAWNTEKKHLRWYTGTFDISLESEHRIRKGGDAGAVRQKNRAGMKVCS